MKKNLLLAFAAASLISCSTVQSGTSKTMDIVGTGVIHKPVIADLNVSQEKVSRTMTFTNLQSLETAKNSVVRELLKEKEADVLVEPTFDSTTKNGTTELTVYGWTATYKNFRQVEEKDLKVLEVRPNFIQKAETTQPATEVKKMGGIGWIIGGAALVVAAVLGAGSL
ncbi:MAG: hypothetical protein L6264_03575 [Weeksellaceae bacterium]|nr:hypothetical protein [Bacteroidota bacterium]MCG2780003.1 hypothetical protein [Weeksellaceae bacterium]